ncbi:MAG: hypothetical protein M3552_17765 [Planctomycetota bacterium]|nr:hypothetical protein [Planctomycetaceae bacterium]MDQ3332468.1 hypothetical protein [Planctomycetota bacterium]
MSDHLPIVIDGYGRWSSGASAPIRAEVTAEYSSVLQSAGFWQRWRIKAEIEREVLRRMKNVPQPSRESLY